MVHSLLAVVLTLSPPTTESSMPPLRTGDELQEAIDNSTRQWARVKDDKADEAARQLLTLYTELRADTEMYREKREIERLKLRSRLLSLSKQIRKRIAREERLAKRNHDKPQRLDARAAAPLAQMAPGLRGRPMGDGGGVGAAMGQMGRFGAPGTQANDNGQHLVDVIQATIATKSWDVNGGSGAIYYWQPGRALIIRQTQQRHEEVLDLLQQLRRAGG